MNELEFDDLVRVSAGYNVYGSIGENEFEEDIKGLEFIGLIKAEVKRKLSVLSEKYYTLTEQGKKIAENIRKGRKAILPPKVNFTNTIFIACAFGYEEIDFLYEADLSKACNSHGYTPVRVDQTEPSKTITEAILRGISSSACILADLTYARPSVYFEVGLGHGLGIPIVLTC